LKGTTGKRLVRFISGGAAVPVDGYEIEPENGNDIITTLDIQMQDIVESALMKALVQNEAQHGTCIVMETKTGKIKALANLGRSKDSSYGESLNYALQATEPGSTIKLVTLLSVLDHGSSTINDLVDIGSTGSAYVGVRNVTDDERSDKPLLTLRECFARSSNVGMSMVAYKAFANEPDLYKNYLHKFHLDKKTGIDLVGEGASVMPKLKRNKEGLHAMVTASFGYAIQVTPLQTLMLYNAIANSGKMMKPYLVNSIKNNGITVKEFTPTILEEQLVKPALVKNAKLCMESVVTEGTGKEIFKDFPFPVAGKTGTAHVADGVHGYGDGIYQATFVGYFPANEPEYTCIVVIKTKPHAAVHFGAALSGPVFKEIASKLYAQYVQGKKTAPLQLAADSSFYQYAGYTPDVKNVFNALDINHIDSSYKKSWSWIYNNNYKPVVKAETISKNTMPDVKNMTMKDALYLLENMDVKVLTKGRGKVVAQDILPGTTINKNQTITLLLN
jgi:cell division protein FtsI (penicillin-binding protein 3)